MFIIFFCTRFLKRKRYDKFYGLCLIFQMSHIRSSEKFLSFYKEMMDANVSVLYHFIELRMIHFVLSK